MNFRDSFRWRAGYGPVLVYCCLLFASFSLALALGQAWLFLLICIAGVVGLLVGGGFWRQIRSAVGPDRTYFRGASLIASGKPDEALEASREYHSRNAGSALPYELAGMALDALNRREEALADADRAVRIEKRWQSLMIRGGILLRLRLPAEALRDLEESYRLGGNLFARWEMGVALLTLRRLDAAGRILDRSSKVMRFSFVNLSDAECQRLLGNHAKAQTQYVATTERVKREIKSGKPHGAILAYCLAQLGHDAEAVDAAGEALEKNPGDILALTTQALVNMRRGELRFAEEKLRSALLLNPRSLVETLTDPQFAPLLTEKRFRELLAWALGAQRQTRERLRERFPHLFT